MHFSKLGSRVSLDNHAVAQPASSAGRNERKTTVLANQPGGGGHKLRIRAPTPQLPVGGRVDQAGACGSKRMTNRQRSAPVVELAYINLGNARISTT
jgi:hypothetical protein